MKGALYLVSEGGPALGGPRAAIRFFFLSFVFGCFYDLGGAPHLVLEVPRVYGAPPMASKGGPAPGGGAYLASEGGPALGGPARRFDSSSFLLFLIVFMT